MSHSSRGVHPPVRLIERRAWLAASMGGLGLNLLLSGMVRAGDAPGDRLAGPLDLDPDLLRARKRELIRRWLYTREDLDAWLAGNAFPFCKYDPVLGYLHLDRAFKEGVDGSICTYRYDESGSRRVLAYADRPCRINSYGNSFTSCEQVSDGETWQEVLAAHLGEPIRNFGIGGYSVYQTYLRMLREEQRLPAKTIIFNIFDDDHFRNLHAWQRPRFGVNRKSTCPPVPFVKADPDTGTFSEYPNPCPTPESLYQLCSLETACALFEADDAVGRFARRELLREQGVKGVPDSDFDDPQCSRRGLYATTRIIELVEKFAAKEKRKVLYVFSYGGQRVGRFINDGSRFDKSLMEFMDHAGLPYVDLLQAHATDFKKFNTNVDDYLSRYFIGHYSPAGNFFCGFAMKAKLLRMLEPPPPAYTPAAEAF
jgi:hypothetical protein